MNLQSTILFTISIFVIIIGYTYCFSMGTSKNSDLPTRNTHPIESLQNLCAEYFSKKIDKYIQESGIEDPSLMLESIRKEYFKGNTSMFETIQPYYAVMRGKGSWQRNYASEAPSVMLALTDGRYATWSPRNYQKILLLNRGKENDQNAYSCLEEHNGCCSRQMWEISPGYLVSHAGKNCFFNEELDYDEIKLWSLRTNKCLQTFKCDSYPCTVHLLTNNLLAISTDRRAIKIYDIRTAECVASLEGHLMPVKLLLQSNNNVLISISSSEIIKWNLTNNTCLGILIYNADHESNYATSSILLLPHNRFALCSGSTIKIWNLETGMHLKDLKPEHEEGSITSIILLKDGTLAACGYYGTLKIWDTETGKCLQTLKAGAVLSDLVQLADGTIVLDARNGLVRLEFGHVPFVSIIKYRKHLLKVSKYHKAVALEHLLERMPTKDV